MKNEFDDLNNVKNDLDNIEEIIISEEEKEKIRKRVMGKIEKTKKSNSKNKKKIIIAASFIFAITGSFALTNESVLASIENVGRSIESFFDWNKDDEVKYDFKEYKKEVIKTVTDKGIKFSVNEVVLDDRELYVSASVDYSEFDRETLKTNYDGDLKIIPSNSDAKLNLLVGDNMIEATNWGGSYEYNENGTSDVLLKVSTDFKLKDEDIETQDMDFNKVYKIKLKVDQIIAQIPKKEHEIIDGNWDIEFEIDGKKLLEELKITDIDKTIGFEYKGEKLEVHLGEFRVSPMSMTLDYTYDQELFEKLINKDENLALDFYDENNEMISFNSQGGGGNGKGQTELSTKWMIDREIDVSKIKVVPVIEKYNRVGRSLKAEGTPEELNIK